VSLALAQFEMVIDLREFSSIGSDITYMQRGSNPRHPTFEQAYILIQ
jgi:hypothetical protein